MGNKVIINYKECIPCFHESLCLWKVNDAFKQAKKTGDIYKVSEYGNTTMHEFFAETFAMYEIGEEELPSYIVEMIKEVINYGN